MSLEEKLHSLTMPQALIVGVVLLFLYYLVMYNDGSILESQIQNVQQAMIQDQAALQKAERTIAEAKKLQVMAAQLGGELEQALEYLPSSFSGTDLMKLVSVEAKAAGANIVRVTETSGYGGSNDKSLFGKVQVQVQLEGAYSQMLLFLSHLTKVNKIVTVRTLRIQSSGPKPSGEVSVEMTASLVGYHYAGEQKEKVGL